MDKRWNELLRCSPPSDDYRPTIFDLSCGGDARELEALLARCRPAVQDTLAAQLLELVTALHPAGFATRKDRFAAARDQLAGRNAHEYGRWVHFPWTNRLVHVLPPDEFVRVRTDRNRHKITCEQQESLRRRTIGLVGLSVGHATAVTLAMEGVGGRFRLADFDTVGLSNLNRIRTGLGHLGVEKCVVTAREMFEIDPFLDITVFRDGIIDANLDRFLSEHGRLDLVIEECDDLYTKTALRERARALGIPVVMETSDRGMLDVERFDREPHRPILHGLLGGFPTNQLRTVTPKEKVPFVLRLIDETQISPELGASLIEVKETIHTWPQLASAVALGAAVVTDVSRRILSDEFHASGRFYVDLAQIICDETSSSSPAADLPPLETETAAETPGAPQVPPHPSPGRGPITAEEARYLAAHAALAPSGGNAQPWHFVFHGDRCDGVLVTRDEESVLDFKNAAGILALGAAAENLDLAARAIGVKTRIEPLPDPSDPRLIFRAHLPRAPGIPVPSEFDWVTRRVTNRRHGVRRGLAPSQARDLELAASSRGMVLRLVTDPSLLDKVGVILGRGDRLRFLSHSLRQELVSELRWSPDEVARTRTGIDIKTLELPLAERSALRLLRRADAMGYLRRVGGGKAFETSTQEAIASTSAVGLLSITGEQPGALFHGGRGVEHLWLTANALGLAFQPCTALVYLFRRLERGGANGFTAYERSTLTELRRDYLSIFESADSDQELMLFRLSNAQAPTARALRLPVDQIHTFVESHR